jgi:2-phosphosulfolactate phosphatase
LIVCAGWRGKVNLEDTLFAGAVIEKMKDQAVLSCDAPLVAQHLYNQSKRDMVEFLKESSHVKRLRKLNIEKDIEFCLRPDQYTVVPRLENNILIV